MSFFLKATTPDLKEHCFELGDGLFVVGRACRNEPANKISISGDPSLSRHQFEMELHPGGLQVNPNTQARNPTGFHGLLPPGGRFTAARTQFHFFEKKIEPIPEPAGPRELTLQPEVRRALREKKASRCLEVMTEFFPALRQAGTSMELWQATYQLVQQLLPQTKVAMLADEILTGDNVKPSRKLLMRARETNQTVLHVWDGDDQFTRTLGTDWALAVPLPGDVILYAEGNDASLYPGDEEQVLLDLVGETLSHHLVWRRLEQVGRFLSPTIRDLVAGPEFERILEPQLREVTVLFFDLRGSSRAVEQMELARYHQALTELMTRLTECVFHMEGTVIDYVGDAILACWGAPVDQADHALRAARAAVAMIRCVRGLGLDGGVGLASGKVMAGQVGARGQAKYGLVGAAPNLASRLEGLTKVLGVPVLLSDSCRVLLGEVLCRRLVKVRPAGMDETVTLHELVLSRDDGGSGLTAQQVADFERGVWTTEDPVVASLGRLGIRNSSDILDPLHK